MTGIDQHLHQLQATDNLRHIPADGSQEKLVDLSTNDYLGIATRRDLLTNFMRETARHPIAFSSSASRLLASVQDQHLELETLLSTHYHKRSALLFNSGYHANTGLIPALTSVGRTFIIADKLVHASIIDGIMLSKAPFSRFPHNDFDRMEQIVQKKSTEFDTILLIVESVYSMDGDSTDIDQLITLKRKYPNVVLYIDEAHAFGVEGTKGLGLAGSHPAFSEIDVVIGTLGKAAASAGAFAICNENIKQWAVNRARSFIFSTALPPICSAWSAYVIRQIIDMETERRHLKHLGSLLNEHLIEMGLSNNHTDSHIQPIIIGSAREAIELSKRLLTQGFKVLPIRTPTVPPGTERLRISLSSSLTEEDINNFAYALKTSLC